MSLEVQYGDDDWRPGALVVAIGRRGGRRRGNAADRPIFFRMSVDGGVVIGAEIAEIFVSRARSEAF